MSVGTINFYSSFYGVFPLWHQIEDKLDKKWGETGRNGYLKWKDFKTDGLFGIWNHVQGAAWNQSHLSSWWLSDEKLIKVSIDNR